MSFTGIQATVDFYTMREADLTNQMTDIMTAITRAAQQTSSLATETNDQKEAAKKSVWIRYRRISRSFKRNK